LKAGQMSESKLKGRTALVTGASKRIGRAISLALAEEGAGVIVHYNRSATDAFDLTREIKSLDVPAWAVQADFNEPEEYGSLISSALGVAGQIDILVNNASSFPQSTLNDLDFPSLVGSLEADAWAPFVLSRDFARIVGRGKIINLLDSRISGFDLKHVGYILAKHVLAAFTRMTALEYAPNITVNGIAPGLILPPPGENESYLDALAHTVPLERHGDPSDIAQAAVFLAKSEFITGQTIFVDGGRHLREK
jgi:pteridine reductase